jgi:hypothetical protein
MTITATGILPLTGSRPRAAEPSADMASAQSMEGRIALRIAARLSQRADEIPADIAERLRFARQVALGKARHSAKPAHATAVIANASSTLVLGGHGPMWWERIAALFPLALLVGGLVLIQNLHDQQQIAAAADIDAALLADDLPPAAYSDPAFAEFLKAPELP